MFNKNYKDEVQAAKDRVAEIKRETEEKYGLRHYNSPFDSIIYGLAHLMESILYIFGVPYSRRKDTSNLKSSSSQKRSRSQRLYNLPRKRLSRYKRNR